MPNTIQSTGFAPIQLPQLGKAPANWEIPATDDSTALVNRLTAQWSKISSGSRPTLSRAEAAWLLRLANHPNADKAVWQAILDKTAGIYAAPTTRTAGLDMLITELKARTNGDTFTTGGTGTQTSGVTNTGTPGTGGTVVDLQTGAIGVDYDRPRPASNYDVDLAAANVLWHRSVPAQSVEDLFSTLVPSANGQPVKIPTHYTPGKDITVIAYDNTWGPEQKDIARFFEPGEVFICVKHHKPQHPVLGSAGKEDVKYDSTHIEVGVGVEVTKADGTKKKGAITLNNPQSYESGLFGMPDYPMIFLKLKFPQGITAADKKAYLDNIRTWLAIANTFTDFPGDYNGGDPLGTRSVGQVKAMGDQLVNALAGTPAEQQAAEAWLADKNNQVYCAELAHVAVNLGLSVPLNKATLGARFEAVRDALAARSFLDKNPNANAKLLDLTMAPESLKPINDRLGRTTTEPSPTVPFGDGLALRPMMLTTMIEEFIQGMAPRDLGRTLTQAEADGIAAAQKALFQNAKPGIVDAVGLNAMPATDPNRAALQGLLDGIEQVVGTSFTNYADFRAALMPLLAKAAQITGPRPNGAGAFMPPHAWLLHALGRMDNSGGVLGVEVVGHGLHASILKPKTA